MIELNYLPAYFKFPETKYTNHENCVTHLLLNININPDMSVLS